MNRRTANLATFGLVTVFVLFTTACVYFSPISWSPDSRKVIFTRGYGDVEELAIWIVDVNSGEGRCLISTGFSTVGSAVFSPDGSKVAYIRKLDEQSVGTICICNPDGSEIRELGTIEFSSPYGFEEKIMESHLLQWRPDGEMVSYPTWSGDGDGEGDYDIEAIGVREQKNEQITIGETDEIYHRWSPDGKKMVYLAIGHSEEADKPQEYLQIVVNTFDDLEEKVLWEGSAGQLEDEGDLYLPSWSPDSRMVACILPTGEDGQLQLWTLAVDGSEKKQLVRQAGDCYYPQWVPDGKSISYNIWDAKGESIWLVNADGTGQRQLIKQSGGVVMPSWSPSGEMLAYLAFFEDPPYVTAVLEVSSGETRWLPVNSAEHILIIDGYLSKACMQEAAREMIQALKKWPGKESQESEDEMILTYRKVLGRCFDKGCYREVITLARTFFEKYPQNELASESNYLLAKSYALQGNCLRAYLEARRVSKTYPESTVAEEAKRLCRDLKEQQFQPLVAPRNLWLLVGVLALLLVWKRYRFIRRNTQAS